MKEIEKFITAFGVTEEEALKALISVFTPCSPGVVRQGWRRSAEYGDAPEANEIWQLMARSDFRCTLCRSQYRITIDHKDRDKSNNQMSNLRVLCAACNRAQNSRGIANPNLGLTIYRTAVALFDELGRFPSNAEISARCGIPGGKFGTARYLLRFLQARLATMQPIRKYRPTPSKIYVTKPPMA
jgi:hypothetical protein